MSRREQAATGRHDSRAPECEFAGARTRAELASSRRGSVVKPASSEFAGNTTSRAVRAAFERFRWAYELEPNRDPIDTLPVIFYKRFRPFEVRETNRARTSNGEIDHDRAK